MEIVKSSARIVNPVDYPIVLDTVEHAIRNCYRSEDKIKDGSAEALIRGIIKSGHLAMLEFADITVKIVCDRAVSHQLVRHRMCDFAQESQRYCNYTKDKFGNDIKVIVPEGMTNESYENWRASVLASEAAYFIMINDNNLPAEVARSVLPNCTATTVYMKANMREWRHIFELRCDKHAQKDIRVIMTNLLFDMYQLYPVFFEDLYEEYCRGKL